MTNTELAFCLLCVFCSSSSQLFIKGASLRPSFGKTIFLLGLGVMLQLSSVLFAVMALKTMQLSQLIPFAAMAYLLVPIGSFFVFNERLLPRFWSGSALIVVGIIYTSLL
ncbi:MAG: hypothetical protein V7739_11540 [Motiliproteus sp.]